MNNKKIGVVIPAAGVGKRMSATIPKQYLKIANKTVLAHSVAAVSSHPNVVQVVIAVSPEDEYITDVSFDIDQDVGIVHGGKERADSVLAGIRALRSECDWVMVHDAARPCVVPNDVARLVDACFESDTAAILATPVRDTMKRIEPNGLLTVERDNLWHALTPQMSPVRTLSEALSAALEQAANITDEASALEWANIECRIVEGSASNLKITRPDDLALARFYIESIEEKT